jgi:hypothetical protein
MEEPDRRAGLELLAWSVLVHREPSHSQVPLHCPTTLQSPVGSPDEPKAITTLCRRWSYAMACMLRGFGFALAHSALVHLSSHVEPSHSQVSPRYSQSHPVQLLNCPPKRTMTPRSGS